MSGIDERSDETFDEHGVAQTIVKAVVKYCSVQTIATAVDEHGITQTAGIAVDERNQWAIPRAIR